MSEVAARTVSDEVGTVGNALAWFYLASRFQEGGVEGAGRWVNDLARGEVGSVYKEGENRLPRMAIVNGPSVKG